MSSNPWTKEQVEQLIEEYKQHPILYSVKNKYYHNRKLRGIALNEILKKIKLIRPETREVDILKKINGLRTSYGHERKKQLKSIENNSTSEMYQPSLWYYDLLSFLNTNIVSREKYKDSDDSRNGEEGAKLQENSQMGFSDELAPDSAGYQSMSTSDPLSEPEIESETKFSFEEESFLKKRKVEDKIFVERKQEYSTDRDDNAWLLYVSTLLGQLKDEQNKVLIRHKITKLLYEEIEKELCDNA